MGPVACGGGGGMSALLEIQHLSARLPVEGRMQTVLHDVSFTIGRGEAVGLVGESGSGKSMTARAVARLLPARAAVGGAIRFDGRDVGALRGDALRDYRSEVAMIFQDPRAHINPVRSIGDFLSEALRTNRGASRSEAAAAGGRRPARRRHRRRRAAAARSTRTSSRAGCSSA